MPARRTARTAALLVWGAVAIAALSACSGSSDPSGTTAAATAPTAAASTTAGGAAGRPDFAAYSDCMAQNGVTLPDMGGAPPSGMPTARPSAMPSGAPAGGGFPGGLPDGVDQATFDAAQAACADLAPQGGPGGAGAGNPGAVDATALAAFTSCLGDHDVPVADGQDVLRDLDRTDATVKAAWEACAPLLPSPPTRATASADAPES
jgi:hypothetical protein